MTSKLDLQRYNLLIKVPISKCKYNLLLIVWTKLRSITLFRIQVSLNKAQDNSPRKAFGHMNKHCLPKAKYSDNSRPSTKPSPTPGIECLIVMAN